MSHFRFLLLTGAALFAAICAEAQVLPSPQMHVECSRGVYWTSASAISEGGRIVVGGENGRYGVKGLHEEQFRWRCLPNEFMIFAVACTDTMIVLGGEGGCVWIVRDAEEIRMFLPSTDTVTALHVANHMLYVGTASGKIWSRSLLTPDEWTLEYESAFGFLAMNGTADRIVACGKEGHIVQRLLADGEWRTVSLDGMNTDGLLLSAVTVTDTMVFVGTSRPSVIRISSTGVVLDERTCQAPKVTTSADHLGMPERVLRVIVNADTIWLSGYFIPSPEARKGTSIHRSVDGGASYQRFPYLETFGQAPRSDFMPLIRVDGDSLLVMSASLGNPITFFSGSIRDTVLSFKAQRNVWDEFVRTDGTLQGLRSTSVGSVLRHPDGERLLAGLSQVQLTAEDESRTYVCAIRPKGNATIVDTISQIPARFFLQEIVGRYVVGHDYLGLPRCSFDDGLTWRSSMLPDSIGSVVSTGVDGLIVFDSLLVCWTGRRLLVADTGLRHWTVVTPNSGPDTLVLLSKVVRSGNNSFVVVKSSFVGQRPTGESVLVCELRGREIVVVNDITVPPANTQTSSSAYVDNGVISIISSVPADTLPDFLFQYRLCEWKESSWQCSLIAIHYPNGEVRNRFQTTMGLGSVNNDIIVLRAGSVDHLLFGLGYPRRWLAFPPAHRQRSTSFRFTTMDKRLYVGGDYHGVFSYDIDGITSVQDGDASDESEKPSGRPPEQLCDGPDRVFTLQGEFVGNTPADVFIDGVYAIRSCTGGSSLGMIVGGRVVARQAP